MASENGDTFPTSPNLFRLDDDDGYEDLLGTQFPNDNPDISFLDLDEDLMSEPAEQPVQLRQKVQQVLSSPQATDKVELAQPGGKRRRFKIPEHAEIIDLDASKTNDTCHSSVQTCVKTENQDIAVHDNGPTPVIKTEEVEIGFSWKAMPEQCINLIDSDEESDNDKEQSDKIKHNNPNSSAIKREDEEWIWADIQREVIELSDSENEKGSPTDRLKQPEQNRKSQAAPASAPRYTALSKVKATRAPADRAKLLRMQKMYAERALGRKVIVGAGGIFKGAQTPADIASAALTPVPQVENELAWMNSTADPDEDANAAIEFAQVKAQYNRKKRAGRNSFEDDVLFMKAESAEKARVKRLDDDYHRDHGPVYRHVFTSSKLMAANHGNSEDFEVINGSSEDELFVRQSPLPSTSLKRPYAATVQSDNDDDRFVIVESDAEESDPNAYVTRKPQSKKKRAQELEKELQESMLAGIEMDVARDQKKAEKQAKGPGKGANRNGKSRKGKPKGAKRNDVRSGSGVKKSKSKKNKSKKPRPTQEGYLNNIDSLFTSNVYEDANANLNRPSLAVTDSLIKDQALKSLLAGVPLEDLRQARSEKQHLHKATKILGARKVKSDGKGGWKFTGMKTSLYHHQVQGAAWMREREIGDILPLGGLQADEMGLGKTVMTIACMISNRPAPGSDSRCTLIVSTPALVTQWESEIRKHAEPGTFPTMFKYHGKEFTRTYGQDAQEKVQKADVVFTSYQEVWKSYPRYQPPKHIVIPEKKREWWAQSYEENRSILHRVHFHRIVLDEAQIIKNHLSQISIACRGLMGKHRWAISGTPIQNRVEEFYPFFKFLHVPFTGTLEIFKQNFADSENDDSNHRLHSFLKQFMIRRTHRDTLFGSALVKMPENTQRTIVVEFNPVERAIYEAVRKRYIQNINRRSRDGVLQRCYSNVLTMLLRLRQLTAHPFMLQQTIEDLFEIEDVEKLWNTTAPEVTADDNPARNMLLTMKKMIAEKDKPAEPCQIESINPAPLEDPVEEAPGSVTLVFKFRRYLRELAGSSKWEDLKNRSLCHKCRDPPDDPWVTSCLHVYCRECLNALAYEAAECNQEETACLECGNIYTESGPCHGLKELQMDADSGATTPENSSTPRTRKDPEHDLKWINMTGAILPSTKTAAVMAQIDTWLKDEPEKKIIVFSQFHML